MGFLSVLKNRSSWLVALVAFIIVTLSGEALIRIADKYQVFDVAWIGKAMELLLGIVQSKIFAVLISIVTGILIGRMSLQKWPEKRINTGKSIVLKADGARNESNSTSVAKFNSQVGTPDPLSGWIVSERDDFDIIPHSLVVRCKRNDSGFDCSAVLFYKNRSIQPIHIQPLEAAWMIGDKTPDGKMSNGVSTPISKDSVDRIHFSTIRIYGEKEKMGQARFAFRFGKDRDNFRCALVIQYDFSIYDYPATKSVDAVINKNTKIIATYYVASRD